MDEKVTRWRKEGRHLPAILRDFHDQKHLFQTIHEMTRMEENSHLKPVSWIMGHMYALDHFLWFMARHGYTLQRSKNKLNFSSLKETLAAYAAQRSKRFSQALGLSQENQDQEIVMPAKENTRLTADKTHLAFSMMVAQMQAGKQLTHEQADEKFKDVLAGMEKWCAEHHIDLVLTPSPGRLDKDRQYRTAYNGFDTQQELQHTLGAFDKEIARLMAL